MNRLMVMTAFVVLLLSTKSHAQSGAVVPQADAGHGSQASCVILKRMGPTDRSSPWYSFGFSEKHFQYVEGKLPEGFPLHQKMTDHDVRNLHAKGAKVIVLDSHYTSEDLKEARAGCPEETGKTLNQAEAKALPAPASGAIASSSAPPSMVLTPEAPKPETAASKTPASKTPAPKTDASAPSVGSTDAALLDVSSTPTEADVYVDEQPSGQTPSTIILMPGDHKIAIKKIGFVIWQKKFKLPSGHTNVEAELVPKAK